MNKQLHYRNMHFQLDKNLSLFENSQVYSLVLGLCVASAIVLLCLPKGSLAGYSPERVIWTTCTFLFLLSVYAYKRARALGENPWLYPSSLLMLTFFVRYGLGLLVAQYCDLYPWKAFPELGISFTDLGIKRNLPNICPLIMLGCLGFYLGAEFPARRLIAYLPDLRWPVDEGKLRRNLVIYAPIALFLNLVLFWILPIEFKSMAQVFGDLLLVFTVIVSYWYFTTTSLDEKIKWGSFLVLVSISQATFGFGMGSCEGFLMPLVMIVLGFILARKSLPWKGLIVFAPVLILVALPWISFFKWSTVTGGLSEKIKKTNLEFYQSDFQEKIERSLERLILRWALIKHLGAYEQYYPEILPFDHGRSFMIELTGQIPRFAWPEKPNMALELNRYNKYVGLNPDPEGGSTGVFDAFTEYYINFGTVGLLLLSLFHGIFLKALFGWLVKRSNSLFGASIFIIIIIQNHALFGLLINLPAYIRELLVWNVLLYFMSRRVYLGKRKYQSVTYKLDMIRINDLER